MSSAVIVDEKQQFLKDFEAVSRNDVPQGLRQLREDAMQSFLSLPFPTTRDEDWRFTNISPIVKRGFRISNTFVNPESKQIERYLFKDGETYRLVFVNNKFSKELSQFDNAAQLKISFLTNEATLNDARVHLSRYARYDNNIFTALNTAFLQDAAVISVPDGTIVSKPIHILFVSSSLQDEMTHPRVLIIMGKQSTATIVESYVSLDCQSTFSNAVSEVFLGERAVLEHYKFQNEHQQSFHIATTQVEQKRDSSYTSFVITLGAELTRNEMNVVLNGIGSSCALNGLYLQDGIQHVDSQTMIDHATPHGTSDQLYKGILSGKSRGVFNGKIVVRKDAQRTDARQTNKNLLLSDGARVNTKPQLEILADDVKCSHGATIGHLEDDALFYMKSRGMSEEIARSLLMFGFINDILSRMKSEVAREQITNELMSKVKQFSSSPRIAS